MPQKTEIRFKTPRRVHYAAQCCDVMRMVSFTLGTRKQKKGNNISGDDKEYDGTPELLELIVATTPDDKIFTNVDYDNYAEIMHSINTLRRNNDESETKSKAHTSRKWKHI